MITLLKLGGSLLTDKRIEATFRDEVAQRIASEINTALGTRRDLKLLIGHGSGSFGHFAAQRHQTVSGVHSADAWRGFAEVAEAAAQLNHLVTRALRQAGVPAWRLQPSASAIARNGILQYLALEPIQTALDNGLIPLVYGDVAVDQLRGGTIISTETIFFYITKHLPVERILLFGETDGVYDATGVAIPEITRANYAQIAQFLGGSAGVDVTGGMVSKVRDMLDLVDAVAPRSLRIQIIDGTQPGLLHAVLSDDIQSGTIIR